MSKSQHDIFLTNQIAFQQSVVKLLKILLITWSPRSDPIKKIYSINLRYASTVRSDWLKIFE